MPAALTSNANSLPGSAVVTTASVDHFFLPLALVPLNFAPTAGPVAPFTHLPPVFSGENSPIRGRSLINAYTCSGDAGRTRVTSIRALMALSEQIA